MDLSSFKDKNNLFQSTVNLFCQLNIPINEMKESSSKTENIFTGQFDLNNFTHKLIQDVFVVGTIDERAFNNEKNENQKTIKVEKKCEDILILIITLRDNSNEQNLTRTQLANITRACHRQFKYVPTFVIFRYANYLSFANCDKLNFEQNIKKDKNISKVSILKDIDINNPHLGHLKILNELNINEKKISTFDELYKHWQSVFDVSTLNKAFYRDLSKWYFSANNDVNRYDFPSCNLDFKCKIVYKHDIEKHHTEDIIQLIINTLFMWFINEKKFGSEDLLQCELNENKMDSLETYTQPMSAKNVKIKGLIHILKSYKFTTLENTPMEEEIALDPELLGRVFENLLANYNPETESTARNQTGSFYTPREIVNYMVDESLILYLKNELEPNYKGKDLENKLSQLLSYKDTQPFANDSTKNKIIFAINKCKIFDPACGSGAFLMGMLQKMVHILSKIDHNNEKWKALQIIDAGSTNDASMRESIIKDIEYSFHNNKPDYARKLYLIKNCIHGVDIQSIAVQIIRLRFLISLLSDYESDSNCENLDIDTLPNLEHKFIVSNVLMEIDKQNKQDDVFEAQEIYPMINTLREIGHDVFLVDSPIEKKKLMEKDKEIRKKICGILTRNERISKETAQKLLNWSPFNQNSTAHFFNIKWMFGISDGFDIVIGNPPYVQLQKDGGRLADMYKGCGFNTYSRMGDIYSLFYEQGLNFVKNETGHLMYITSNKWMRAGYGESLRNFLSKYNTLVIIDFGGFRVFESATVDTNILLVQKSPNRNLTRAVKFNNDYNKGMSISNYVKDNETIINDLGKDVWFIGTKAEIDLQRKIETIGEPLKNWGVSIHRGILTGYNDAFIIDTVTKEKICDDDPKSSKIIKPILRGRDINKYSYDWSGLWIINTHNGYMDDAGNKLSPIEINDYPAVKKHLDNYLVKLKNRYDKGKTPYNLRDCSYLNEFQNDMVVWQRITQKPTFCKVDSDLFILDSMAFFVTHNNLNNLNYLLSVLNSNVIHYYALNIVHQYGSTGFRLSNQYVELMPIPLINDSNKSLVDEIGFLVNEVLSKKHLDSKCDTDDLEANINALIYRLYGLSVDEITLVERSVGLL